MPIAQVPASYIQNLIDKAVANDCSVESILSELQIQHEHLKVKSDVSAFVYGQLYQRIMRESNDEWLGMFVGGRVPLGAFRLMCITLLHCVDFRQAIYRIGEFAEICKGMKVRLLLEEQQDKVYLRLGPVRSLSQASYNDLESSAAPNDIFTTLFASFRLHSWLVGREFSVEAVHFTFGPDRTIMNLKDFQAGEIHMNAEYNQLVYPAEVLDYPIIQNLNSTLDFVRTAPYHLVVLDPTKMALKEKVRNILNRDVGYGMPGAEEVARQLNMSVATLRRKLMGEQTSFQALKDEVRLEAAIHYLSCLDFSNAMVAEKLGFDEPSAFFRAFKKWTGETPGHYRTRFLKPERSVRSAEEAISHDI